METLARLVLVGACLIWVVILLFLLWWDSRPFHRRGEDN